ncbi:MAG TPA: hypothetical protein VKT27_09520 [Candidatus Binataceae bacterium]|nr:hypothetical protein [Candidatus Binataceae bacterium]
MTRPRTKDNLDTLVGAILEAIERGRNNGSFAPSQQAYFRWRLEGEPKYSKKGVELPSARGETNVRPSWAMAVALIAQREVPQTREFQATIASLQDIAEIGAHADQYLQSFVFAVAGKAVELHPHADRKAFEGIVGRFLDDIERSPFECGAEVQLEGLVLESEKIVPSPGVVLRRPTREDFEQEVPYFGPGINLGLSYTRAISAIATVTRQGAGPRDAQLAVEKLIVMLRLFMVASVKYLSYRLSGDSIIYPVRGQVTSGARQVVSERAFIRSDDEPRLLRFWHAFEPIIPD